MLTQWSLIQALLLLVLVPPLHALDSVSAVKKVVLFDGELTDIWECREGSWIVDADGNLTCQMEEAVQKNGKKRLRGMGYLWTRQGFSDFVLELEYRLSKQANSGVFFRTDPNDPVQGGLEIQLLDNEGIREANGKVDPKKQNVAFYDCQGPSLDASRAIGEWNHFRLSCRGPIMKIELNGKVVNEVDLREWTESGKNPDGTQNKFKKAMSQSSPTGRIGFQNHGKQVWFRNVSIVNLGE